MPTAYVDACKTRLTSIMLVLACFFSFIIIRSRHLTLVHFTGGLVQDVVDVAVYSQAVILSRWSCM